MLLCGCGKKTQENGNGHNAGNVIELSVVSNFPTTNVVEWHVANYYFEESTKTLKQRKDSFKAPEIFPHRNNLRLFKTVSIDYGMEHEAFVGILSRSLTHETTGE
jgi:hypothetical protein